MNMQEFTDTGYMDAEAWLESEIDATILEASILDQIYDARDNLLKDAEVKFDSEPKENQDAISELSENCQFEADQGIGIEESEKESAHGPYYIDENGNIFSVLSVSDGIKPFESHPSPNISDTSIPALSNVKPETDSGLEELFDDSKNQLLPESHEVDHHIAIAEQWDIDHVEVDHGFGTEESEIKSDCVLSVTGNGDNFPVLSVDECFLEKKESYQHVDDSKKPVELLPSFSIPNTPIRMKPETAVDEMLGQSSEIVSVTDVLGRGEAEHQAFPRNGTDGAQLLENLSRDIDVLAVESVENATHISEDKMSDINSCVADTTFPINVQDVEIQIPVSGQDKFLSPQNPAISETECVEVDDYPCNDIPGTELAQGILNSDGEATTFHTDDPDTKNEEIIVIVENNDMPTEVVDKKSVFNHEISSGIASSNASSIDVLSSKGDASGSPVIGCEESIVASGEASGVDYIIEQEMAPVVKQFFLVKMPNFDDLIVQERARQADLLVDEKTRLVDSLRFEIRKYKENSRADVLVYEALMSEAREIKKAVQSQRAEIDSLNTVMNRVKNALAIENIDNRVAYLKHYIEHETIPSDVENTCTREIKQLNQLREYLSSNLGDPDDLQLALNNRDETERQLQSLKRELDGLKENYMRAEALARAVEHRCRGQLGKLKEAQAQFRAADNAREEAYKHMQSLKREMHEKIQQFHKYKVDASVAYDNAAKGEILALSNLCFDQVEGTMLLWNDNPEFRKEYVRCNMRSTVERLGLLDGRSLGPDEKAVMLSNYVYLSVDVHKKPTQLSHKKPTQPSHDDGAFSGYVVASGSVEEEQLANKEKMELLTEAAFRERRRLEEKSKALEALTRKKKIAEKAQTRAEIRAQKEAKQKEKEREKRLRKKERRRSSTSEASDANSADIITRCSETTETMNESDTPAAKRICQKPSQSVKQSKTKMIPPSLRNKNRKKLHHLMWVMLTCMVVILVFFVGNVGFFNGLSDTFKKSRQSPAIP